MRFKDELVEVKLYKAIDGMKSIVGRLETATESDITLVTSTGQQHTFAYKDIAKANLHFEF